MEAVRGDIWDHEAVARTPEEDADERNDETEDAEEAEQDDYRWSTIVLSLVKSAPFQMRRVGDTPLQPSTMRAKAGQ